MSGFLVGPSTLSITVTSTSPKQTDFLLHIMGAAAHGKISSEIEASPFTSPESPDGTGTVAGSSQVLGAGLFAERSVLNGVAGAELVACANLHLSPYVQAPFANNLQGSFLKFGFGENDLRGLGFLSFSGAAAADRGEGLRYLPLEDDLLFPLSYVPPSVACEYLHPAPLTQRPF